MRSLSLGAAGLCAAGLLVLLADHSTSAQDKKDKGKTVNTVKVGDKAPKFSSVDDQGKPFNSKDVVGKKVVVLFFYPAALTGG